jgi:hypothetical protein
VIDTLIKNCKLTGINPRTWLTATISSLANHYPWLRHVFADGGYAGHKLRQALRKIEKWSIEIIKRSDHTKGRALAQTLEG